MKKIYFVRHGQSQANIDEIGAGAEMDTPLTKEGERQARETAIKLKDKKIDLIISSPLSRTLRTAEIIAEEINYDPAKIVINPQFIERGIGKYSGRPIREFGKAVQENKLDDSVETAEGLVERVKKSLQWLANQPADNIVLVSHSDVSAALRLIQRRLPHTQLYKLEEHSTGAIYEFDL